MTSDTETLSYEDIYGVEYANMGDELFFTNQLATNRSQRVLEIGCGTGRIYQEIRQLEPQPEYFGVDYSASAIAAFRQSFPAARNLCGLFPDVMPDMFRGAQDALLFTFNGLSYIESAARPAFFQACRSALSEGGHLMLHFFRFDPARIKASGDGAPTKIKEITVKGQRVGKYLKTELLAEIEPGATKRTFVYRVEDQPWHPEIEMVLKVFPCVPEIVFAELKAAGFAKFNLVSDPVDASYDPQGDNIFVDMIAV